MPKIWIDADVFRFLETNARPFEESKPNDVLRRLLLDKARSAESTSKKRPSLLKAPSGEPTLKKRAPSRGGPRHTVSTEGLVRRLLSDRFGGRFQRVRGYQMMFESETTRVYFQNFNRQGSKNLWYRLRRRALDHLDAGSEKGFLCFTNPSDGVVYVIPVKSLLTRTKKVGWDTDELEVNIDPATHLWRELDWDLRRWFEKH